MTNQTQSGGTIPVGLTEEQIKERLTELRLALLQGITNTCVTQATGILGPNEGWDANFRTELDMTINGLVNDILAYHRDQLLAAKAA